MPRRWPLTTRQTPKVSLPWTGHADDGLSQDGSQSIQTRIWSNNLRSVQSSASPESELCLLFAGSVGRSSPNFKSSEKQFGLCGSEGPEFKSLVEPRNLLNLEVWPCRIRTISHREVDQKLAPAQSFESNQSRKEDQIKQKSNFTVPPSFPPCLPGPLLHG